MIKFLHLSDSHLGESMPLYHTPPNNWRGESFIKNYYKSLEPALQGKVDFVLHSGDLFDKHHINMDIIGRAMVPLRKIAQRNIPILIVPGNHEREHIPGGLLLAGRNIHIFSKPETFEFSIRSKKIVVAGFPYIRHESRKIFKKILKQTGWKYQKNVFNILLCHQTIEGAKVGIRNFTFRNGENVVPISEIPSGFDYIACGHIHKQQILKTKEPTICYAGSTERVNFQEMNENKGFYIVIIKNGIPHPKFHKLSATEMEAIQLDTIGKSVKEIIDFLEEKIYSAKPFSVIRFYLQGEIEIEKLKQIPLYLYKRRRDDIKVEFRKEKLIILKDRKRRFYDERAPRTKEKYITPYPISIDDQKKRFLFIKKSVVDVPPSPGVYMLMNKDERVLYIGKAKDLRSRLLSHLRKKKEGSEGFYFWLSQVVKIDVIETGDEFSALFLEMSLIRSSLPPYNKQIKEFQNYVYVVVQKNIYFPTIKVVDEIGNDGNPYFGPFRKEYKIRENIKFIKELFGIRPCRRNLNDSLRLFSCPLEEMGKCDAPCKGSIDLSVYQKRVERMINFLNGNDDSALRRLEREKRDLVKIREFGKVNIIQNTITNLTVIFNSLRRIRRASEINGSLILNFGKDNRRTFRVKNGRVVWNQGDGELNKRPKFPPQKWELDEMMLIASAFERKERCFLRES